MRVGFLVTCDVGRQVVFSRYNTSTQNRPTLLTYASSERACAIHFGRLHYLAELLKRCGIAETAGRANCAATVLLTYDRFGIDGLTRLEGDFSCVVFDRQQARVFGLRDPMGGYPLFWLQRNGVIALSTCLKPLVDLLPDPRPNREYLADFLITPSPYNEQPTHRCVFDDVSRLRPGILLEADLKTGRMQEHLSWDWLAHRIDPASDRVEDVGEQLKVFLSSAIEQRLQGRCASHLSGGMDSTAVTLLAGDAIVRGVGETPLHTISLVYKQLPGLAREAAYLQGICGSPGYVTHAIDADDLLDFDSFADPPLHDEPYNGLWRLGMDQATFRIADEAGAATILTGIGADEMFDVLPLHITDLLRGTRPLAAWRESVRWARSFNCSAWNVLYPYGIAHIFAGRTSWPFNWSATAFRKASDWAIAPWILPAFVRRYSLRARVSEIARKMYSTGDSAVLSFGLHSVESRVGDLARWSLAAPRDVAITHPFLDARVLCLGLGMMSRLKPHPGRLKPILVEAMRDVLPDRIRNRPRKGHFNEVYYLGLARNLPMLERMIDAAPLSQLDMIDKQMLIRYLREASFGGAHVRQMHRLNSTLSLIKWLSMQQEWFTQPMAKCEAIFVPIQPHNQPPS